jgi:hypothetical protein
MTKNQNEPKKRPPAANRTSKQKLPVPPRGSRPSQKNTDKTDKTDNTKQQPVKVKKSITTFDKNGRPSKTEIKTLRNSNSKQGTKPPPPPKSKKNPARPSQEIPRISNKKQKPTPSVSSSIRTSQSKEQTEKGNAIKDKVRDAQDDSNVFHEPTRALIILWLVLAAELVMDIVTTVISFNALVRDGYCCGKVIDLGRLPLGITIPFFLLILIELTLLIYSVKLTLFRAKEDTEIEEMQRQEAPKWKGKGEGKLFVLPQVHNKDGIIWFRFINVLVLLNPFFGCLVAWMLLYQSNKRECFSVLGLEAASLLLHWASVYLEGNKQTWYSRLIHCIPLIPFLVTVLVILIYIQEGGVCYLVADSLFWYEGCLICEDGSLPDGDGLCPGDDKGAQGDFCGNETESFCFYEY